MKEYLNKKTNLLVGPIDSGKTKGILFKEMENIINKKENFLVLDLKEEYYKRYYEELVKNNYEIKILNLKNTNKSNNFNIFTLPLYYYQNNDYDKAIELIDKISKMIFIHNDKEDPFWTDSAASLFTGLCLLIMKEAPIEEVNLGSVLSCLDLAMDANDNKIRKYLDRLSPLDPIYVALSGTIYSPIETMSGIVVTARQTIKDYCIRPNLLNILGMTDFNLEDFGKKNTAIFVIPTEDNMKINNIANVYIDQIISIIKYNNIDFNIIIDNIESINKLDCLNSLITTPKNNLKLSIATRDINNIKDNYSLKVLNNILNVIDLSKKKIIIDNYTEKEVNYPTTKISNKIFNAKEKLK